MTNAAEEAQDAEMTEERTPRVALMGEFSAGKSTLSNLLLGADPLPVKITATRLPPVWITLGSGTGVREDIDGTLHPLGPEGLDGVSLDDTRLIQLEMQSGILKFCDLVDMPGISDPNMDADVWRGVVGEVDVVIWCTHATQAWRQSEASAFDSLPDELKTRSILLITRFDKLRSDRDRKRVIARVTAETKGQFRAIYPVALLDALNAGDSRDKWESSGAEPFIKGLLSLLKDPGFEAQPAPAAQEDAAQDPAPAEPATLPDPTRAATGIKPVRVAPSGGQARRTARPPARGEKPGMMQNV